MGPMVSTLTFRAETTLERRNHAGALTAATPRTMLQPRHYAGVPRRRCTRRGVGTEEWCRRRRAGRRAAFVAETRLECRNHARGPTAAPPRAKSQPRHYAGV